MRLRLQLLGGLTAAALGLIGLVAIYFTLADRLIFPAFAQLAPLFAALLVILALIFAATRHVVRAGLCLVVAGAAFVSVIARTERLMSDETVPAGATEMTLVSYNVMFRNAEIGAAVPEITGSGADVVLLLEARALFSAMPELAKAFPYRLGCDSEAACDSALLSKWPLEATRIGPLGAFASERFLQARIAIGGTPVTVIGAHLSKPYFDAFAMSELNTLRHRIEGIGGPMVVAGDFNAPPWYWPLVRFAERTGFRTARAFVPTWPTWSGPLGLPIDHVFARSARVIDLKPLSSPYGSNHKGLIARIALLPGPGPAAAPAPAEPAPAGG
ncbi:endonuclease/exonuclease/phosphatase family protein [Aureimonas sp. AU12]|uniref:endonuclease/exonuclease/phosphatase family protein n=1 Tax=Aureimonas sp. AU12 TaxID=1638161 RepID=UPI0007829469|nr:endonuclease/exonuclease/phosphatase family protein [Aureimonas sp. AU12]